RTGVRLASRRGGGTCHPADPGSAADPRQWNGRVRGDPALVSCLRSSLAKAADAGEDVVCRLEPHERLRVLVVKGEEEPDGILEFAGAAVGPAPELLFGEDGEPALNLVDPGAVGGRVVDREAGVAEQPAPDQLGLVSAVVVEHEVDVELGR